MFTRYLRPGFSLIVWVTLITGVIYPLLITVVGETLFATQARGSLIESKGVLIGSRLIGQNFSDRKYFWGRPSATAPQPNNGTASGGSNFGPLNPALIQKVQGNAKALHDADPTNGAAIPVELVTASASGLDPDISPAAALYQSARVAHTRDLPVEAVRNLITAHVHGPLLGIVGESTINVLELNIALDAMH